jgi:hypothetical protein
MIHIRVILYALMGMVLCASCGKHYDLASTRKARVELTKHFDVPVPLGFTLKATSSRAMQDGYSDFMRYNGTTAADQTIAFYKREMERSGWDINDLSTTQEGFLFCCKPSKHCGVQIQPGPGHTTIICLFITQKVSL